MDPRLGIPLIFAAALSWSTTGLFTRVVTTDLPTTVFWRSLIGGLCVLGMYAAMRRRAAAPAGTGLLRLSRGEIIVGALAAANMLCFISAFFYTTIANVTFLYGVMPLATFGMAILFLGEKPSALALACCLACIAGVGAIVSAAPGGDDLFGIGLAFAMAVSGAAMTIAARRFPRADMIKSTYLSGFLCALATAPFASLSLANALPSDYFWLTLYGVFNVAFGFGAYLIGAQKVAAVTAALICLIEIPLAPVWAWLLFAEMPGVKTVAGGAIVLSATILYLLRGNKPLAIPPCIPPCASPPESHRSPTAK